MDGRIYSPEKGKFVSLKTKHGQKVLKNYNEHRLGGDKHHNCAYCKIVNPKTGKLVSTYGQTGGRVIRDYVKQEGGGAKFYRITKDEIGNNGYINGYIEKLHWYGQVRRLNYIRQKKQIWRIFNIEDKNYGKFNTEITLKLENGSLYKIKDYTRFSTKIPPDSIKFQVYIKQAQSTLSRAKDIQGFYDLINKTKSNLYNNGKPTQD